MLDSGDLSGSDDDRKSEAADGDEAEEAPSAKVPRTEKPKSTVQKSKGGKPGGKLGRKNTDMNGEWR